MTVVDVGTPVDPADTRADRRRVRRRWFLAVGLLFIALTAVAVGLWLRWLYSAHAFGSAGGYELASRRPVGAVFYSPDMTYPDAKQPVTVDIRSVSPRIVENTAGATVEVLICHRNDAISHLGSADLSFCAWTQPFSPGALTLGGDDPGTNSIILAITTRQLGTVVIDGVHVTFRQGLRHGREDTGGRIVVRAIQPRPPKPPITKAPTITAVTPSSGGTEGQTRVVVVGDNFTTTASVRFGNVDLTGKEVSVVTRRRLVVVAPAHIAGIVDVRVVTTEGVSPVVAADRYTFR